jgi:hypothetical protein
MRQRSFAPNFALPIYRVFDVDTAGGGGTLKVAHGRLRRTQTAQLVGNVECLSLYSGFPNALDAHPIRQRMADGGRPRLAAGQAHQVLDRVVVNAHRDSHGRSPAQGSTCHRRQS